MEWENFTGSISYMPLTLSTQRLLNVSGQIVTNKEFKKKILSFASRSSPSLGFPNQNIFSPHTCHMIPRLPPPDASTRVSDVYKTWISSSCKQKRIQKHFLERRELFLMRGTWLDGREMTNDENYCLVVHPVRMTQVGTSTPDKLSDFKIYCI